MGKGNQWEEDEEITRRNRFPATSVNSLSEVGGSSFSFIYFFVLFIIQIFVLCLFVCF